MGVYSHMLEPSELKIKKKNSVLKYITLNRLSSFPESIRGTFWNKIGIMVIFPLDLLSIQNYNQYSIKIYCKANELVW